MEVENIAAFQKDILHIQNKYDVYFRNLNIGINDCIVIHPDLSISIKDEYQLLPEILRELQEKFIIVK